MRLKSIWRSAGWPCRDEIELDLLAAGWAALTGPPGGHQTLCLTEAGVRVLSAARQRNQQRLGAHERLADRMGRLLLETGRLVWRELPLRARVSGTPSDVPGDHPGGELACFEGDFASGPAGATPGAWRLCRPDVFSVRNTSVEDYLQPMVHEVKVSRSDLLSDLRQQAKREAYQWLSCETYYVFPAHLATPQEIPEAAGVWLLEGSVDSGRLVLARPARHVARKLPFPVWMALAKSVPMQPAMEGLQRELGDTTV